MDEKTTYYTDLLTRYFSGEIQGDELRLLSDWLKEDPKNEETFKQYQKTWQLVEKQHIHSSIDVNQEWESLQTKMAASVTVEDVKIVSINPERQKTYISY